MISRFLKQRTLVILSLFIMTACQQTLGPSSLERVDGNDKNTKAPVEESESMRLIRWLDEKYQELLYTSPMTMTNLGIKERYGELDDFSIAGELKELAWREKTVRELKNQFDYSKLDEQSKLSYDLWVHKYEEEKEESRFYKQEYIFHQMSGIQAYLPQFMINFHRVSDFKDMQAYISRLSAMAVAIKQQLTRAQESARLGIRPPRFAYDIAAEQAKNVITGRPFTTSNQDSPLYADAQKKINALLSANKISDTQRAELMDAVKLALVQDFQPAYAELIQWLEKDGENAGVNAVGVGARTDGSAYYAQRLKEITTTELTAKQIHEIGLSEVERIQNEMIAVKERAGFSGSLKAFFTYLKKDDQFYYPNTDDGRMGYIRDAENFLGYIDERLPEYFGILPKADLVVKRVEAFREQAGAPQHYMPGTPDGSRPGVYYAHLIDMRAMPKIKMEAIAYHEGNPGHHMQLSISQELEAIPEFRKQMRYTAYVEGWALYSELLAKEMGAYKSHYSDFGRLVTEQWRAIRLVVDTGLHALGWTEERAVQYFLARTPIPEAAVRAEVRRYLVIPGQATAYKIGMLKILELRAQAKERLKDDFDIRQFHDTILAGGALPLGLLERRVDNWVNSKKRDLAAQ